MSGKARNMAFFLMATSLLWIGVATAQSTRQSTFIGVSSQWAPPSDAYDVRIVAIGPGGGGALSYLDSSTFCAAGGGSGAKVNTSAVSWASGNYFAITIGQGGAPGTTLGGDGTPTIVVVKDSNGNTLQTVTAYGGGGGSFEGGVCVGGAGGGASSSASGATPGTGTPSGGFCEYRTGPEGGYYLPREGAAIGDIKGGSAGGYSSMDAIYPASAAGWSPLYSGGNSDYDYVSGCFCAGGAAGGNGNGPSGACAGGSATPLANSGAGGATQTACLGNIVPGSAAGAAGAVFIEYSTGPQPSPSSSPMVSPSPLPATLTVNLKSATSNGYLSVQSNGKVSASSTAAASWTANALANGKWSLKSSFNKYLTIDSTGKVTASATAVTSAQQFDLTIAPADQWTLKSATYGTYLDSTTLGVVSATTNSGAKWTRS
ncbi:Fascin-like incomplete domain protein [Mollivirus kamchatka]|nr:Fascin-like incomplete domain protein [Mollivirus kamchatka]